MSFAASNIKKNVVTGNALIKKDKNRITTKFDFKDNQITIVNANLSAKKVFSRHTLIDSYESQIQFINGDILIDRLLLSMGKLGAADLTGTIKNDKKFTNLKFENNIYIDNLKRFYNKFGVTSKQKIPYNLFVSGNFDLVKLNLKLHEISSDNKINNEDVIFVEREFNNIILDEGYESLFNFSNMKEFVKLITSEDN